MSKTNLLPAVLLMLLFGTALDGQNFSDALRYSQFSPEGTARFIGAGSALGPLGADFSVISTNPAGLAWMRRSELVISPGLYTNTVQSGLVNGSNNADFIDISANFALPNVGMVIASRSRGDWKSFNFALGLNRLADFNQQFYYEGQSRGSIVNRFEELANGQDILDDFESGLAFDADALLFDNGFYFSDFTDFPEAVIERNQTVTRSGSLNEFSFGFGANYDDKVMWGLAVGVPFVNFEEEKFYEESDPNEEVPFFNSLNYAENLRVEGGGINVKLGLILRLNQAVRIAGAIHTPTFYELTEFYTTDLTYRYTFEEQDFTGTALSPEGSFTYSLRSPWRFSGGAGFIFAKNGFLSGEVEYVNYGKSRFGYDGFTESEREVNQGIEDNLGDALQVRLGAEYAAGIFRFRGGLGLQQAPLIDDDTFYNTFSLGAGLRQRSFFIDLAYRRQNLLTTYSPYLTFDAPQQFVDNDSTNERFVLSLGFKF